jgi:hypothetical protein
MGAIRFAYKMLVGYPEGKRPLGKPWHRWDDNIKMGHIDEDWIQLSQDKVEWRALVNTVMNLWAPSKTGNVLPDDKQPKRILYHPYN